MAKFDREKFFTEDALREMGLFEETTTDPEMSHKKMVEDLIETDDEKLDLSQFVDVPEEAPQAPQKPRVTQEPLQDQPAEPQEVEQKPEEKPRDKVKWTFDKIKKIDKNIWGEGTDVIKSYLNSINDNAKPRFLKRVFNEGNDVQKEFARETLLELTNEPRGWMSSVILSEIVLDKSNKIKLLDDAEYYLSKNIDIDSRNPRFIIHYQLGLIYLKKASLLANDYNRRKQDDNFNKELEMSKIKTEFFNSIKQFEISAEVPKKDEAYNRPFKALSYLKDKPDNFIVSILSMLKNFDFNNKDSWKSLYFILDKYEESEDSKKIIDSYNAMKKREKKVQDRMRRIMSQSFTRLVKLSALMKTSYKNENIKDAEMEVEALISQYKEKLFLTK